MRFLKRDCLHTRFFVVFLALLLINLPPIFGDEASDYDPYAPIWQRPEDLSPEAVQKRAQNQLLARILEQPFRPLGYGLGKSAEWVERHHVDDKVVWFFDELSSRGIYPAIHTPTDGGFGLLGPGGRVKINQLLGFEQSILSGEVSGGWAPNYGHVGGTTRLGVKYDLEPASTTPFFNEGVFRYFRSSSESFFGLGPRSSLGEWSTYQPEETRFEEAIGYHVTETIEGRAAFVYQHMNIGNGNRERVGKIKEHFSEAAVRGLNGGNLIGFEMKAEHDSRDHEQDPRRGGYEDVRFSYFHDTDGSDFHYLKVSGSASHFFRIFSDRRIVAVHVMAEKSQELGDGNAIPFFNMSRLGGARHGTGSALLRSFRPNRFYGEGLILANVEYRYRIYEYDKFTSDAVALADIGEVFGDIGDFEFDELDYSFGGGIDLKFRRKTLLSCVLAKGNEGWRFSVGKHTTF